MDNLNPRDSGQYDTYNRGTNSGQYDIYHRGTPNRNRNPETAWSKKRIATIISSVLVVAAISAGITIGVTKGKRKSNTVQVLNFVLKKQVKFTDNVLFKIIHFVFNICIN